MKKGLAWILAFCLTAALCVPVGATEPVPDDDFYDDFYEYAYPYGDGYSEGYDQGYADFEAGKDRQVTEEDEREADRRQGYVNGYVSGYEQAELEHSPDYQKGYDDGYAAGYAAGLAGEDYDSWGAWVAAVDGSWEYQSGYSDGYDAGYSDGMDAAYADPLEEAGWQAGRLNVMVNGKCVQFGKGVWPERKGGRIMVPVRKILETLGAEVTYEDGVVTAERDGLVLRHTIGTKVIQRWPDGNMDAEPETLVMDKASYISRGRTLVPVRFVSEAFGYEVYWDEDFETAVIVDEEAFCALHDSGFDVVNLLLSDAMKNRQSGQNLRTTAKLSLDLTLLDSLNGDRRVRSSMDMTALSGEAGMEAELRWDLGEALELLMDYYGSDYLEDDEKRLMEQLKQSKLELRCDREKERIYFHSPILEELAGTAEWLELPMNAPEGEETASTAAAWALRSACADSWRPPVYYWSAAEASLEELGSILGDEHFTKSGSTYIFKADQLEQTLNEAIIDEWYWYWDDEYCTGPITLDLDLRITDRGNGTCTCTGEVDFHNDAIAFSGSLRQNGGSGNFQVDIHVRNLFRAAVTADIASRTTNETVQTTPPPSQEIGSWEDLYLSSN